LVGSVLAREKRMFSAKLRKTPENQRGTEVMGRDSSTTRVYLPVWMMHAQSKNRA
jgi:hypothetical protein